MKRSIPLLWLFIYSACFLSAQITIDQNDFAGPGDTVRMSVGVWNPLLNFSATGANHTWDFSQLEWQSQYVDTFLNPMFTGPVYAFVFSNLPTNPYRSNIAKKEDNILTSIPIVSTIFTNPYNFYYKTAISYRQKGIGMRVSGFPTAVPMKHPDTLYRFPIEFGNEDSSWSDYSVIIPQLGVYSHQQHRINKVDGWGTLTTPFGTFDVLRVRTEIHGSDSLYIDTLNFGFRVDNDIQREYKWFGKNQMEPLLQINTQAGILGQFQNFEFVTKIVYRDSVRFQTTSVNNISANEITFSIYPNPSNGWFFVSLPDNAGKVSIILSDLSGRVLLNKEMISSIEAVDASQLPKGIYLLTLQNETTRAHKKIAVE